MRNVRRIITINCNFIHLTNAHFNKYYLIPAIKEHLLQLNPILYDKQCIKKQNLILFTNAISFFINRDSFI